MHAYVSYGLGIHSTLVLPELTRADGIAPDIVIRSGETGRRIPKTDSTGSYFRATENEAYLFWERVGGFLVMNGRDITVEPLPGADEPLVRLPLLGAVLSVALHQRGLLGLHGSAVSIDGQAVAFLGISGSGKSTMAAALYARGHPVLADDLVALEPRDARGVMLFPSFPQLKLYPEVMISSLGDDPDRFPKLLDGIEKRARVADNGFTPDPVPIKRIYILDNAPTLSIEPIRPQERMTHLISQSYGARIFKYWLKGNFSARHFMSCAELINKVPIYWLRRPRDLTALTDVARAIEDNVRGVEETGRVA